MKHFNEDGLSFSYPDEWTIERETGPEGWTVSLQSPGTAFAVVRLDRTMQDVRDVAAAALEALREDYPTLDATSAVETMAGDMAIGHDIEFISLDLTNSCWTRCFYGPAGTVLVLCQVSDVDSTEYEPALRALCASMRSEDEGIGNSDITVLE
jgi:hypothetical protein